MQKCKKVMYIKKARAKRYKRKPEGYKKAKMMKMISVIKAYKRLETL